LRSLVTWCRQLFSKTVFSAPPSVAASFHMEITNVRRLQKRSKSCFGYFQRRIHRLQRVRAPSSYLDWDYCWALSSADCFGSAVTTLSWISGES
jgi:hypothetical protein